jgi:thiol-disulfide isomerase/thioredoxin
MLLLLFSVSFSSEFTVSDQNIQHLFDLSYETPVFLLIYSSYCGYCRSIHPAWRECMARFSNTSDVIVAELDVVSSRKAGSRFPEIRSFPSWVAFFRGNVTTIRIARDLHSFMAHAQSLARMYSRDNCTQYVPGMHSYPSFALSVPNASCGTVKQICYLGEIADNACLLVGDSKFGYQLAFFLNELVNITLKAESVSEILEL